MLPISMACAPAAASAPARPGLLHISLTRQGGRWHADAWDVQQREHRAVAQPYNLLLIEAVKTNLYLSRYVFAGSARGSVTPC